MRVLIAFDGSAGAAQAVELAEAIAWPVHSSLRRDADAAVGRGDPAAEIIDFAENHQADLIVLGSRGRSALAEIVLGSVARNVLAGSTASVLVVREAAQAVR